MSMFNLNDVTKALESASLPKKENAGLSFEEKGIKLNTADDAKPIVDAILACKELGYLNLAGNTLGVDAAEALSKALEKHPEFKRALWKDIFTGRSKEEIPKALQHLGNGLVTANARLTELDLSDNAFGPIGVKGLASLLRSGACYALQELRLNNNGLGIGGGKLLAAALLDCFNSSKAEGSPLALKVFIAGRNRLENEGAKALAQVFETIGTFEEIAIPQNGIYHVGITALSESFAKNTNLQVLNLNDNTIGPKGSKSLANALENLTQLRVLNLGDCLLKTKGAELLTLAIARSHQLLEEINFEANEIKSSGGIALAVAVVNKPNLQSLKIDGNQFGSVAIDEIRQVLSDAGHADALCEFEDDESEGSDEDDDDDEENEDIEEEEEDEEDDFADDVEDSEEEKKTMEQITIELKTSSIQNQLASPSPEIKRVTVLEFLLSPTSENFLALGENRTALLKADAMAYQGANFLEAYIPVLMKVSALAASQNSEVTKEVLKTSNVLYEELFNWAQKTQQISLVNNTLLVHLGLIKSEDKKYQPNWNLDGCLIALESSLKQQFFPSATKDTLKVFMGRCKDTVSSDVKNKLMTILNS